MTVHLYGIPVVQDVSFTVNVGERVAIVGPSGAGKSTLIKTIIGLLQPQSGSVKISDNRVAYVPQFEGIEWDFPVTVGDIVMMGSTQQIGWLHQTGAANWRAAYSALQRVGMAHMADRQISTLSAGEQRRAFIARAIAQEAHILLLDEPFSGAEQTSLMETLNGLNRDGMTLIIGTQDYNVAFSQFDHVLALRQRVIIYGTPAEVYSPDMLAKLDGSQAASV